MDWLFHPQFGVVSVIFVFIIGFATNYIYNEYINPNVQRRKELKVSKKWREYRELILLQNRLKKNRKALRRHLLKIINGGVMIILFSVFVMIFSRYFLLSTDIPNHQLPDSIRSMNRIEVGSFLVTTLVFIFLLFSIARTTTKLIYVLIRVYT